MVCKQFKSLAFLLGAVLLVSAGCPRGGNRDPKRSANRAELAKDYLSRGQLEQAEIEAKAAIEYDDRNVEALSVMGLVAFSRGVRNLTLVEVEDCLTGVDAEALRAEMDQLFLEADKYFTRAVDTKSDYGEGWYLRGTVANLLENYQRAVEYLEKSLQYPQSLGNIGLARATLGWAYFHLGDHAQAAKELRQAEQFNPEMCVAKYRLGRVYFDRKEWNKALEQFQAVAEDSACRMQEAHLYLLKTHKELGMSDTLADDQARCVELAPRSCIAAKCRAAGAITSIATSHPSDEAAR